MIPIAFVYFSAGCVGVFVALALAERVGRRPLLLFAVGATCLGLLCFALADVYAPGQLSSLMGFLAALILTQSLVIGLDRLPLLLIAELMPQGV
jgi:MFS family permease